MLRLNPLSYRDLLTWLHEPFGTPPLPSQVQACPSHELDSLRIETSTRERPPATVRLLLSQRRHSPARAVLDSSAFHYIGLRAGGGRDAVDEYIKKNAVTVR